MHILITGAAGMIGRKLTERLVDDGGSTASRSSKLTLTRCRRAAARPPASPDQVEGSRPPISPTPAIAEKAIAARPDVIFHSRRRGVGRGRARFRQGLPRQSRRHARAAGSDPPRPATATSPKLVYHLVDGGVRRAVPARDPRRFPSHAAHLLRHAEGDRASCCWPTTRGAASATASASACPRSWCGPASPTRRRPASSPASSASRSRGTRRCCRSPIRCVHTHASPRSAVGFLIHAAGLPRDALGPRINLTHAGRLLHGRRADRVAHAASPASRSPRASAASPIRWSRASSKAGRSASMRAARSALGFKAESTFDEIVRTHIVDDRGGNFVA